MLFAILCLLGLPTQDLLINPGFEAGPRDSDPIGWLLPGILRDAGYSVSVHDGGSAEGAPEGEFYARIESPENPEGFGNLVQTIDARPLRGRIITVTYSARAEGGGRAQPWLRVGLESGAMGFLDNCGDRPVTSSTWDEREISLLVNYDAKSITLGCMLMGEGAAEFDDVRIDVRPIDLDAWAPAPPAELSPEYLERLVELAEASAAVRWFHPSDAAAEVDWHSVIAAGVLALEEVDDPASTAFVLSELFGPIAPTARFSTDGSLRPVPGLEAPEPSSKLRLVHNRHVGLGSAHGGGGVYSSSRDREKLEDATKAGWRMPADPARLQLGDDLHLQLPTTLWGTRREAWPATDEDHQPHLPDGFRFDPADRTTRLAATIDLWTSLDLAYPYFDVVDVDWDTELRPALQAAAQAPATAAALSVLRRLVAKLQDGHGFVSHAADPDSGALPLLFQWSAGVPQVLAVGPAALEAGIEPGDRVVVLDGRPVEERVSELRAEISGATEGWIQYSAMRRLTRGPYGTSAALELVKPDGTRLATDLKYGVEVPEEERPETVTDEGDGRWYVDLTRIDEEAWKRALPDLAEAKHVTFDMRGYPSGVNFQALFPHLSPEPLTSPQWWLPVVTRLGPDGEPVREFTRFPGWNIRPSELQVGGTHTFLTDGRAISYAESCMAIVEAYDLGTIEGARTAGTNGNINILELPGGFRAIFTGMRVLKHDGSQHHGIGIAPDVETR